MDKNQIILATDKEGNEITIGVVNEWIKSNNKANLTKLIYDRLYGRYLKPFDYTTSDYKKYFKNGFAIMTSCCLLIETYVSFIEPTFRDTNRKSARCFGWFFNVENEFNVFSKGGLSANDYLDPQKSRNNKGLPRDFYINVRCGILHNAETRNGWRISRQGDFFNETEKIINASLFSEKLKKVIKQYQNKLINS